MELTVNDMPRATASSPATPLLTVLREEFAITGPKPGCEQGGCGACTVLVDGEPRRSCLLAIGHLEGAEIITVEGLGNPQDLAPVQAAFNDRYAAQCRRYGRGGSQRIAPEQACHRKLHDIRRRQ